LYRSGLEVAASTSELFLALSWFFISDQESGNDHGEGVLIRATAQGKLEVMGYSPTP
jgi:hypothetical protein